MAEAPIAIGVRREEQLVPGEVKLFPADPTVTVQIGAETRPIQLLEFGGRQTAIAIGIAALHQIACLLALDRSIAVEVEDLKDSRSSPASIC
jgi:hypothetical protein